jgi:hypothetical protein
LLPGERGRRTTERKRAELERALVPLSQLAERAIAENVVGPQAVVAVETTTEIDGAAPDQTAVESSVDGLGAKDDGLESFGQRDRELEVDLVVAREDGRPLAVAPIDRVGAGARLVTRRREAFADQARATLRGFRDQRLRHARAIRGTHLNERDIGSHRARSPETTKAGPRTRPALAFGS